MGDRNDFDSRESGNWIERVFWGLLAGVAIILVLVLVNIVRDDEPEKRVYVNPNYTPRPYQPQSNPTRHPPPTPVPKVYVDDRCRDLKVVELYNVNFNTDVKEMGKEMQDLGAMFNRASRNPQLFLNADWILAAEDALEELEALAYPLRNTHVPEVIWGANTHADILADLIEEIVSTAQKAVRSGNYSLLEEATEAIDLVPVHIEQANIVINRYLDDCGK